MEDKLNSVRFEHTSGIADFKVKVPVLKKGQYHKLDFSVGGEAPKDVISIYQYKIKKGARKANSNTWPVYIAKIGHKWYPNESITEQLITEIGYLLPIKIANSRLFKIENTVRFCSEHFHNKNQVLNHGAEILSNYRKEPNLEWIDQLEEKKEIKDEITVVEITKALKEIFPEDFQNIYNGFFSMLLFDCFIGNNDRHYYNWGVITHIQGNERPYFSPIYDTARGLWWNNSDKFVLPLYADKDKKEARLRKYIKNAKPKITIPNNPKCNHFQLIKYLKDGDYLNDLDLSLWKSEKNIDGINKLIDSKFRDMMIPERRNLIKLTLKYRFEELFKIL